MDKSVQVNVPEDALRKLSILAAIERRSIGEEIRNAICNHIEANKEKISSTCFMEGSTKVN